jgi:hypothetical protein
VWITLALRANIEGMDERDWESEKETAVVEDDETDSAEAGCTEVYTCAFCGEENEILVDRTVSKKQQFTEDCDVCCRPNLITVQFDPEGVVWIDALQEDEA